ILPRRRGFRIALRGGRRRRPVRPRSRGVASRERRARAMASRYGAAHLAESGSAVGTALSRIPVVAMLVADRGGAALVGRAGLPARRGVRLDAREDRGPDAILHSASESPAL